MAINLDAYYERQAGRSKTFAGANVRFFLHTELDPRATEAANGVPKHREVEMIEVQYPGGDRTPVKVEDKHKIEYKEQYEAFKANIDQPVVGSPLTHWPMMDRPTVEEFRYFGIKSVEQLATLNDEVKRKIGPLAAWCKKAKDWLKAGESPQTEVFQLRERCERLERDCKKYQEQITLLIQRIEATEGIRFESINSNNERR